MCLIGGPAHCRRCIGRWLFECLRLVSVIDLVNLPEPFLLPTPTLFRFLDEEVDEDDGEEKEDETEEGQESDWDEEEEDEKGEDAVACSCVA